MLEKSSVRRLNVQTFELNQSHELINQIELKAPSQTKLCSEIYWKKISSTEVFSPIQYKDTGLHYCEIPLVKEAFLTHLNWKALCF